MKSVTLKSGNTLELQECEFTDAWNLTQAIARELSHAMPGLKLDSLDPKEVLQQDIDVGKLFGVMAHIVGSKEVFELVWPCAKACLLNEQKIDKKLFTEPSLRGDFLPVVVEIVKLNVLPFMKGLDLSSLIPSTSQAKQKSQK